MSPILAAILISTNLIIFFSFLSLKIDLSIKWNWFYVFIPLFLLKFLFLSHAIVLFKRRLRFRLRGELLQIVAYIITNLLILSFEILICLRLEYDVAFRITLLFAPLWIALLIIIIYLLKVLAS